MSGVNNDVKVTVAMYISSFSPNPMGGMEIQGLRLAQQLEKAGIKVTIFTHGFKGCKKKDAYEGIQVIRIYSWLNTGFEFGQRIANKLKRGKKNPGTASSGLNGKIPYDKSDTGLKINGGFIDLVYYFIQFLNLSWTIRTGRKQFNIIHVHGVPWVSFVGTMAGRINAIPVLIKESTTVGLKKFDDIIWGTAMRSYILRHASFVAISRHIYTVMLQYGVPDHHIYYVPNGVAIPEEIGEEAGNEINVLFVGNLTQGAAKGLDVLLQAWRKVIQEYPAAQLLIAGNITDHHLWLQYLADLDVEKNVVFLGNKNNMTEIYKRTTVFVSSSRREGLSNALLEAMAFGLPCIVTNISGSQDMIETGKNGLVVEPDDAGELTQALLHMLSSKSLRQSMRKMAYNKVKNTCSFEKIGDAYIKIYLNLSNLPKQ